MKHKLKPLDELIYHSDIFLAHLKEGKQPEKLIEHMNLTFDYYLKLSKEKGLYDALSRTCKSYLTKHDQKEINLLIELFENAIWLHDIGKINPSFQYKKMKNKLPFITMNEDDSSHSLLSSLIYLNVYFEKIANIKSEEGIKLLLFQAMILFSYIISRHHGYLDTLDEYFEKMKNLNTYLIKSKKIEMILKIKLNEGLFDITIIKKFKDTLLTTNTNKPIELMLLSKLLYSTIIACDYYATGEYMTGDIADFGCIDDIDNLTKKFYDSDIYHGIMKYKNTNIFKEGIKKFEINNINFLRSDMFLKAEEVLIKDIDNNIFYLEAPTGSGKTLTSMNLAFKIIKEKENINKIFYVFPFNALSDQTEKVVSSYIGKKNTAVINSVTPIKTSKKDQIKEYNETSFNKDYQKHIFLHYPCVLTSHVKFFNILFGTGREDSLPFAQLTNSVIILDEIQSYKNNIWKEIITMLAKYSKLLGFKLIIMSATLPELNILVDDKELEYSHLIKHSSVYFSHRLFKNRVTPDYTLLNDGKNSIDQLVNFVKDIWNKNSLKKRILIEFISKKSAREFYKMISKSMPSKKGKIFELTGDDNGLYRNYLIDYIKNNKDSDDILLVSTQVIEAGVDIDMDIGLKDIVTLDSDEQFVGRINRSCYKKDCKVYFFDLDNENTVYQKSDVRLNINQKEKIWRNVFIEKDFKSYYKEVLSQHEEVKNEYTFQGFENFKKILKECNFRELKKKLRLIDDSNYQIYLAHDLKNPWNDEIINGKEVWNKYKKIILSDMNYTEKMIRLSEVKEKINYFTYNVKEEPLVQYEEEFGGIYYISNGVKYIQDNKFNREKYIKDNINHKKGKIIL